MSTFKGPAIGLALALALAGCTSAQQTTALADAQTVVEDANDAISLYGIAKGIAQVAAASDPKLAGQINAAIKVADPIVAKIQLALADGQADATMLAPLVATIKAQAQSLTQTSAPAVTVVSN